MLPVVCALKPVRRGPWKPDFSVMYQPRTYRQWVEDEDLVSFVVVINETDLFIRAKENLYRKAVKRTQKYRNQIEEYIAYHPEFVSSFTPIAIEEHASEIVRNMGNAGMLVGTGPMAAVAGAIAESVGKDLLAYSSEIIVENGGDIFLKAEKKRFVGIYAGESGLSGKLALEILPEDTPLGICTSSGTVGHSISFGKADAVTVISPSASVADAAATAIGNIVKTVDDINKGIEFARAVPGIEGILIIVGNKMGLWGKVRISEIASHSETG